MSPTEFEEREQRSETTERVDRESDDEEAAFALLFDDDTGDRLAEAGPEVNVDPLGPTPVHWRVLLAPFGLTVGYALLAALVGPGLFDPNAPGTSGAVAWILLGGWVLLSGWSTARLHDDASWHADGPGRWHPNARAYVLGGAGTVTLLYALQIVLTDHAVDRPALVLGGTLVVSFALASIVAGPVYVVHRRRHQSPTTSNQPRQR